MYNIYYSFVLNILEQHEIRESSLDDLKTMETFYEILITQKGLIDYFVPEGKTLPACSCSNRLGISSGLSCESLSCSS